MLHSPHLLSHFPTSLPFPHRHFPPIPHFPPFSAPLPTSLHHSPPPPLRAAAQPEPEPEGPVELFPSSTPIFAVDDNPSNLQVATSVLLTGAISVFLFRSLRRRANRFKELRVRSTGVKTSKDLKEEAIDRLRAVGVAPVEAGKPPSPVQAMLGGIAAGVIAVILYKFTTTIEASLNRQTISDNFSVRQITITIRTIINGICYLATFVFGINSVGLLLYSIQLAFSSIMDSPANISTADQGDDKRNVTTDPTKSTTDSVDFQKNDIRESSDDG
ncbi:uncharacterized protein M6B38_175635 [Iris pallida]|uniref:Transmembrane protein n=1 Tax=Iris pallida TaxID=29817 RepID=A0AAX6ER79_IRIPA|nr:uncharacterized protein M6B38_175635 [Iris pallida]